MSLKIYLEWVSIVTAKSGSKRVHLFYLEKLVVVSSGLGRRTLRYFEFSFFLSNHTSYVWHKRRYDNRSPNGIWWMQYTSESNKQTKKTNIIIEMLKHHKNLFVLWTYMRHLASISLTLSLPWYLPNHMHGGMCFLFLHIWVFFTAFFLPPLFPSVTFLFVVGNDFAPFSFLVCADAFLLFWCDIT